MNAPRFLLAAMAVGLVFSGTAALAAEDDSTVVAKVNDQPVTLGEMRVLKAAMGEQTEGLPDAALWDMLLDQLTRQLAVAEAGEEGLTPRDEAALVLQRRAYLSSLALEKIAETEPSEDELKAAYDASYGSGEDIKEYNAQHILVDSEEAIKAVEEDLKSGKDFGQVAKERSTGPSGPGEGDLGWFTLDMMVPPFADAVAKLDKGEVSGPVKTSFGWHIIRLNDTRTTEAPEFDEVRGALSQEVRRDRVEAEARKLLDNANIEKTQGLDPEILKED